ncbi:MAG: DUF1385 domain-containing protein [Chloroflexi bacterium]|nr:DUF1385 domain-containing protein [Chloroflexota bacterium]
MEGVMMRGQRHMAVAVRAPDGKIVVHEEPLNNIFYKHPVMKLPFFRGLLGLWDALGLGIKALIFSADVALQEEKGDRLAHNKGQELRGAAATTALTITPLPMPEAQPKGAEKVFSGPVGWVSITISIAMVIGMFFVLPVLAASLITKVAGWESGTASNITEGVIRIALFIGYIWGIGRLPDIKRVFGYHGAEHKTINAYEAGVELTPESVQSFTLLNPRCGTTFLLIVMLLATVVFVLLGKLPFVLLLLSRIALVPVIASVAYEFIRLMANLYDHALVRAIIAPGLALQKMTTRPPDLSMIEVGIAALKAVLVADGVIQLASPMAPAMLPQERIDEPAPTLA